MTADFNKPIAEDQFLDVLTEIRDKLGNRVSGKFGWQTTGYIQSTET